MRLSGERALLYAWISAYIMTFLMWTAAIFIDSSASEGNLAGFGILTFAFGVIAMFVWGGVYHQWFKDF